MAHREQDDFQLYFSRVRPVYHQLFNLAHAITGNCEQAEYCLQYAMLDCWASGDASASRHGFREGLRNGIVRTALRLAADEQAEFDWDGLAAAEGEADPLLAQISQESTDLRRALALRYGCGLSPRRIAKLMHVDASRVQLLLKRCEARARRGHAAGRGESPLVRAVRGWMSLPSPQAPEMGSVFRGFQADAAAIARPNRLPARIARGLIACALALLCIAAFWFAAVLMQPAAMDARPEAAVESAENLQ